MDADYLIEHLCLTPLPGEGGFYRETYRSCEKIPHNALPSRYTVDKSFGTAIYYLITHNTFSVIHHLPTDEIFHFYLGDPVVMLQLHPDGSGETIVLGPDLERGQCLQCIVPKETWQGVALREGGRFALMGTSMAPAFDFHEFEPGKRRELIEKYPDFVHLINRLTSE